MTFTVLACNVAITLLLIVLSIVAAAAITIPFQYMAKTYPASTLTVAFAVLFALMYTIVFVR